MLTQFNDDDSDYNNKVIAWCGCDPIFGGENEIDMSMFIDFPVAGFSLNIFI